MSRLLWFLAGIVVTLLLLVNGKRWLRQFTPQGVAERVERGGRRAAAGLGEFYATFDAARRNREEELRRELDLEITD
ncbi:hypothetical protein EII34_01590 [Arachnia propionica]|uniref:Uncharacterized protein n=1 Tax=Arachnia propionica TaxID=1750 RepID=A0A3P1TCL8_9ACTN|nr:hypothetical protein [Arachnia propionica]MDO5081951.1 hypothetical protein [Arachnia propionica]RRD07201.1 hypothetical protein EII34_01590 [Arachnia propionica]